MKAPFVKMLEARQRKVKSVLCVGLDTDYSQIPQGGTKRDQIGIFNSSIIQATHDLVCSYKPNIAFYEAEGVDGYRALADTMQMLKVGKFSDIPVILDAKRADIGNTNNGYVKAAFDDLGADAITVHPTLGSSYFEDERLKLEALKPFLAREDKGIIVLCRTSNPSAGEFQDLPIDLTQLPESYKKRFGDMNELREIVESNVVPFYQIVAYRASRFWNEAGNIGLVVGATYPEQLAQVRKIVGDGMPILIPGIGAQGGDIEATVRAGQDSHGFGIIVNSSRGIIFANDPRAAAEKTCDDINSYRYKA